MEQFILGIAEKTILGAGFFYLLRYLVKDMEIIVNNLVNFGKVLNKISGTLVKMDMRIEKLEDEFKDLKNERELEREMSEGGI